MVGVKRIYVEKKPGFDIEAAGLLHDLMHLLGIKGLERLRIVNRYDIEGITESEYSKARETVFSEPPVDYVCDEILPIGKGEVAFAYEYLPGQYDQRADSCAQCIQLITQKAMPVIRTARVIVLKGKISEDDFEKIKKHLVNPVDSRIALLEKPVALGLELTIPELIETFEGFIDMDSDARKKFMIKNGLAMSIEDLEFIQKYFKHEEKRNPTVTEIRVIDTYWSDHCRHTTFLTNLDGVAFKNSRYLEKCRESYDMYREARKKLHGDRPAKPESLMDIALMAMREMRAEGKLADLEVSDEINACSMVVNADVGGKSEEWLVMFKNETHNHPTEIEPYGGAATCLGGAIRDPLSGRSYVYQAMRVTGCADPTADVKDTLPGKLPQIKITREAAHGYSSYGNQIGLATGQVHEVYDPGFLAKRMEIGAVIAAAPRDNVKRLGADPGDLVLLLGGRTGRDGCGGATGSSKEHTEESLAQCGAEVQKGNPPTERKIQRLFRNPRASRLIKKCNDFGAGGVAVAIGELAPGLSIDLDKVPKKYEGLDGTELAISESQERMAVVVDPADAVGFIELAREENLECEVVAEVMQEKRLQMFWNGACIVDLSREFLDTNGAAQHAMVQVDAPDDESYFGNPVGNNLLDKLRNLNSCSLKGLAERFDSTIGAGSIIMPFGGKHQMTPQEGMAARLPVDKGDTNTATVMTFGYNPRIGSWSPFHGALYAVLESVSKVVAMGGDASRIRLTLQEYFEKLGKDPARWGKPFAALLGAYYAQKKLGIPAVGGKDSMSGTFMDIDVPPTLVSFAVSVAESSKVVSSEFKKAGSDVVLLDLPVGADHVPDLSVALEKYREFKRCVDEGQVLSAMTVKEGGIAETVAKMGFGNAIGFKSNGALEENEYYKPKYGCIVAEVVGCTRFRVIGNTRNEKNVEMEKSIYSLDELLDVFTQTLEEVFPTKTESMGETPREELHKYEKQIIKHKGIARPRVFIPVFPGTNCEYDSGYAFEKAGAESNLMVFRNISAGDVRDSVDIMTKLIKASNIIMIPGGFSAGDEPEGSGKFIATVFRNPYISEAVMELLEKRDGLILGICNGFQALIKLGLLPYGEIRPMASDSPTLTFNSIGRHVSRMVQTKVTSDKSPWLSLVNAGDIHTIPVSHGEGRFIADESHFEDLFRNGQVATQYVDTEGRPTYDSRFNPNGSMHAVEGITSLDGRIFGKMGHSERIGTYISKNIPGDKDQLIFEAGARYFR
ncbi:MAG: phosphoribosylformylglycinamidine synthase [Clostridia bacterium]|nr:phosphoribosylformylglycinamidine synthase [Clostridia bacterium]